jgi:hypothetical protein
MSSPNSNVPFKKGNQVVYIPNNNDYNNLTERKINNPYTLSTKQLVRRAQQSPEKEMQRIERMAKIKRAKMIAEDIESRKGPELPAKEKYMLISDLDKSILDIKNNINKPGGFEYVEKELRTMIEDINFKISEINKLHKDDQLTKDELSNIIKPYKIRTNVATHHLFNTLKQQIENIENIERELK